MKTACLTERSQAGKSSATLFGEPSRGGQTHASSLEGALRGEEWIKTMLACRLIHSDATVGVHNSHILTLDKTDRLGVGDVQHDLGDRDDQHPTLRHGVAGVDREIKDHLLELIGVDVHVSGARVELEAT